MLGDIGNGEFPMGPLPGRAVSARGTETVPATWARRLLVVTSVATLGVVGFWTFGRPLFSVPHRHEADPDTGTPNPTGEGVDWWRLDRILRQSFG